MSEPQQSERFMLRSKHVSCLQQQDLPKNQLGLNQSTVLKPLCVGLHTRLVDKALVRLVDVANYDQN